MAVYTGIAAAVLGAIGVTSTFVVGPTADVSEVVFNNVHKTVSK